MIKSAAISTLLLLYSISAHTQSIEIHTDNKADLNAFKNNNRLLNLTTTTNLFALSFSSRPIKFEYMTTKRSLSYMDKGLNICVFNKIKTSQRAEKYLFSRPINLFMARRLYQHVGYPPLIEANLPNTQVDLTTLFNRRPDSQMLVTQKISYGDFLDKVLNKISDKNKLIRHSGEQDKGVISMFAKGRAEFALLFPHQVFVFDSIIRARSYEISDLPPYALGRFMCSNTEENKLFLEEIDKKLTEKINISELLNIHLSFINSVDKEIFTDYFYRVFNK